MHVKKIYTSILLFLIMFSATQSFAQVSQETMRQIQVLLNEKSSRTASERKIDSRLLQAVRENLGQKMADGITLEKANVDADAFGLLKVDINAEITDAFLSKITSLGGKIIFASPQYHTVRATINLKSVAAIASYKEVKFIQPAVKYMLEDGDMSAIEKANAYADRVAKIRAQVSAYLKAMSPLAGKAVSEGDVTHRAADVRSTYNFQGQGIKIGVLSDSYNAKNAAANNVTAGDLPGVGNPEGDTTPVTVVQDFASGSDEGRAMLQVIHDLAPKATLFFATADLGEASFATNIQTLRNTYHCNIIVDDVFYYDEPAFQDGIVAQAVNAVTADGALYFASAGNAGSVKKGTAGVYEGDFNDAGSSAFTGSTKAGTIHNFGTVSAPVNGDIVKTSGLVYNMNWSDPWGASGNDYDLFLISASGTVKASSTNIQAGTDIPYEEIFAPGFVTGDRLVVFKTSGAAVRAFHVNTNRGTLTVATVGQTKGHASAANAFAMAATPAHGAFQSGAPVGPYPNPFNSTNKVEDFSSDGPRRKFYQPDGTPITPGNFLFGTNGGIVLAKPDLTAADGVKTTFGVLTGLSPFYGTSCAAPHAGAIAALILSGNPSLTASQVRTILTSTALDIEDAGYDNNSGYGIIQAFQAAGTVTTSCNSVYDTAIHNTFAKAVSIPLATNIKGTIKSATDSDFYKFTITKAGQGSITLSTLPADYDLYIYTSAKVLAASSKKRSTTSEVLRGNLPKGTYYAKVVGFNGAFNTGSCYTLNITQSAGFVSSENLVASEDDSKIDILNDKKSITLYPNPASSVLNVILPKYESGMMIKVNDIFGKSVISQTINSANLQLNIGKLSNGTYLLNLVNKDGNVVETTKFVKQ